MEQQNSNQKILKSASLRILIKVEHSQALDKTCFHKGQFENHGSAQIFVRLLISSTTIVLKVRSEIPLM